MKSIKKLSCLVLSMMFIFAAAVTAEAKDSKNVKITPSASTYYCGYNSKGKPAGEPIPFTIKGKSFFSEEGRLSSVYVTLLDKSKEVVAQAQFSGKYLAAFGVPANALVPSINLEVGKTKTYKSIVEGNAPAGTAYLQMEEAASLKRIQKKITIKKLTAPKSVKASANKKSVKITFKKASGATKYEIFRAEKGSSKYKKIATTAKTSYTDKKVKKGKRYTYQVRSVRSTSYRDEFGKKKTSTIRSAFGKKTTTGKVK